VTIGLPIVDASVTRESNDRRSFLPRVRTSVVRAMVRPDHIPRRIPDHGVEPGIGSAPAVRVEKDLRKFEFPMKKPMCAGRRLRHLKKLVGMDLRQRAATGQDSV